MAHTIIAQLNLILLNATYFFWYIFACEEMYFIGKQILEENKISWPRRWRFCFEYGVLAIFYIVWRSRREKEIRRKNFAGKPWGHCFLISVSWHPERNASESVSKWGKGSLIEMHIKNMWPFQMIYIFSDKLFFFRNF